MGAADRAVVSSRRSRPRTPSAGTYLFNFLARLVAWYTLYTVLFQCPSHPTDDSPTICHTSHALKTNIKPHVQPYYDSYVSPHVEQIAPYVQYANKEYITPAYQSAYASYRNHGEPYVDKGKQYAVSEYDRVVKPHMTAVQKKGYVYYDEYLQPHVLTANEIWVGVKPKVIVAEKKAEGIWRDHVLPTYEIASPYLITAYEKAKHVVMVIVAPIVKEGGEKAMGWGKGVWSEVVRPQVGRINKQLGRSNGNGFANDASHSVFASLSAAGTAKEEASSSVISSMISSVSSKASASASKASKSAKSGKATATAKASTGRKKLSKDEERVIIDTDLKNWVSKFSASADKAIADLKVQIYEITEKALVAKQKQTAKDISNLEKTVDSGLSALKSEVIAITKHLSAESSEKDKEAAYDKLFVSVRRIGTNIRDDTQSIRKEAEAFLAKSYDDVSEAADQHLDVLDGIHDMGMQELGMKWAWMDHVTWKDWKKYHQLKADTKQARIKIIKSAESNDKLADFTKWVEDEWQGQATEIARNAAEELKKIKKVGKKKIELADSSDDFSKDFVPVASVKAAQKFLKSANDLKDSVVGTEQEETTKDKIVKAVEDAKDKIEEAIVGPETPAAESIATKISEKIYGTEPNVAEKIATAVSEKIYGTEPDAAEKVASAVSVAADSASRIASKATEEVKRRVPGGVHAGFVTAAEQVVFDEDEGESYAEFARSRMSEASKTLEEAIRGTPTHEPGLAESIASRAEELSESALQAAYSVLYPEPIPTTEAMYSIATDKYSRAVAAASSILYGTPTPTYQALLQKAKEAYASATDAAYSAQCSATEAAATAAGDARDSLYSAAKAQYSQAVSAADASYSSIVSAGSEAKKIYDAAVADASKKLDEARSAASTKVYGTPQPVSESYLSVANEKYSSALGEANSSWESVKSAASTKVYGTPKPKSESIISAANEKYSQALADASSKYEAAKSAASTVVYGTPQPASESYLSVASEKYSSAIDEASSSWESFKSAASTHIHGTLPPASERVYSSASAKYSEALQDAASKLDAAKSAALAMVNGTPQPASESYLSAANEKYSSAISEAQKTYDSWASSVSVGIYGTPTPAWQSAADRAQETAASAATAASQYLFGTPAPSGASASLESAAAEASAALQSRYDDLNRLFTELIHGKEQTFSESVMSRFNVAVYGTPTPVWQKATSAVADTYVSVTSAVGSMPPAVESIVSEATRKLKEAVYGPEKSTTDEAIKEIIAAQDAAVKRVSVAIYGTPKGTVAKATDTIVEEVEYLKDIFENARNRIVKAAEEAEGKIKETKEWGREKLDRVKDEL